MGTKSFIWLFIMAALIAVFSACTSTHYFAIEIKEPAKITFPPDVSTIVVVNNAASPEEGNFDNTFILNKKEIDSLSTIAFDTAVWNSVFSFAKGINDEKFFSKVLVSMANLRRDNDYTKIIPLSDTIRQFIFKISEADAIISIDRCLIEYNQNITQLGKSSDRYTSIKTKTDITLFFSTYIKGRENPLSSFTVQDSLTYSAENIEDDSTKLYDLIPNHLVTIDAALQIGKKAVPYFIPSWKRVERELYSSSGSRMREAFTYAKAGKWPVAEKSWLQLYNENSNPKSQAYLAHNLAVASEMQDNFNEALEWAQKAETFFKEGNEQKNKKEIDSATTYVSFLSERIHNDSLLNKQFGFE